MVSSALFLPTITPPSIISNPSTRTHKLKTSNKRTLGSSAACRASASSSSSTWMADFDLYGLLGVESSSDQSEIKRAYRALQKRCHPDIAGPAGHDMAIVLNDVYSLLSDPVSRSAYDQEQAKLSEFRGYTGKPLYSTWSGSEAEQRAVFVDEVKCVGCLKCALHASRTFAIESAYGRARVISQWADPEDKILDAIQICPVDCISMVERSDLAALEFLMSKQPRGDVRMTGGGGSNGGVRVSNIFAEVDKFQRRFMEMQDKASRKESQKSDLQMESRNSAVQGIMSVVSWWYWRPPSMNSEARTNMALMRVSDTPTKADADTAKLREAVDKLKSQGSARSAGSTSKRNHYDDEYWTPTLALPSPLNSSTLTTSPEPPPASVVPAEDLENDLRSDAFTERRWRLENYVAIPAVMAVTAAVMVGSRGEGMSSSHGIREHIGGSLALQVVNSFEMQVVLAAVTWFVIGMGLMGVLDALVNKGNFRRQ